MVTDCPLICLKCLLLGPNLSQMNQLQIFTPYFVEVYSSIAFPSRLCLPNGFFPSGIPIKKLNISHLFLAFYISYLILFYSVTILIFYKNPHYKISFRDRLPLQKKIDSPGRHWVEDWCYVILKISLVTALRRISD